MKFILFNLVILLISTFPVKADIKFCGKILTYDEKIPKLAHVTYHAPNGKDIIYEADENGYFSINIQKEYLTELTFSAVDHISIRQKFPIPVNVDSISLDAKLIPNQIFTDLEQIFIAGNFNQRDTDNPPEMIKNEDGKFTFKIEFNSDTLIYQIFPQFSHNPSNRTYNGSQSDFFIYDGAGDYNSAIMNKSRKFEITFDPDYYPKGVYLSSVEFENEQYTHEFNVYNKTLREYLDYLIERSGVSINKSKSGTGKDEQTIGLKKEYLKNIEEYISEIKDENIRRLTILEYLHVAMDGMNIRGIKDFVNKSLVNEIFEINPNSEVWNNSSNIYRLAFAEILSGNLKKPKYWEKILDSEQSDNIKAGYLATLVHYCYYEELEELFDKYYDKLQAEFADTKEALRSRANFGKNKKILVDKNIPDFKLPNLDNESEFITPNTLKGKYVLVDIWGTWCMPCLLELPNLHNAYQKLKSKNFTIYSIAIDTSPQVVKKFRDSKNKFPWLKEWQQFETNLPWLHSYGGNWDSEIINTFEVTGVPTVFLIDPNGKIIATSDLRGENLTEILEGYIK